MPKEVPLISQVRMEFKALAITVLADRYFRNIALVGEVDPYSFPESEDRRLLIKGKWVYKKSFILDIIRVAQTLGVDVKKGWRGMAESLGRDSDECVGHESDETSEPGLEL